MPTVEPWPSEWLRGVLEVCVLRVLANGPTYGYAISVQLAEAGLGTVKGGTLYPLLSRLETAELVTVEWRAGDGGPGRKFYRLTQAGHARLHDDATRWRDFARLTRDYLADWTPDPTRATPPTDLEVPA